LKALKCNSMTEFKSAGDKRVVFVLETLLRNQTIPLHNRTMSNPTLPFKTYLVGGSVRDGLLGRAVVDRDWVVVGATPETMLAAGFKPVGADFPVFLHPITRDEYALARTERKSGRGYHGFTFFTDASVTLEEDLARRDLTINAIAQAEDGTLVDPYGGQRDLRAKVLRHVSNSFAEDPLRVLRLARFAARFADFTVAPETIALAKSLKPEIETLTPERVWQEFACGLMEAKPQRMFEVLAACDAWSVLAPEIPAAQFDPIFVAFSCIENKLEERFAILALAAHASPHALAARWKVPRECGDLAEATHRFLPKQIGFHNANADEKVDALIAADAFRRPERFAAIVRVCAAFDASARETAPQVFAALAAANTIAPAQIASTVPSAQIGAAVRAARVQAIKLISA
jgi:tRNA nucleotidyltransferase (CCA-adding enzyme)